MSDLVLDETNTSRNGTELVGESQDWGGNDYVFQVKTRLTSNGVTGMAVQAVSNRSAWALLRTPLFRALWIASLTSSIGTWMHEVGAAWLMTSLTLSPVMVALMQTAASLPIVLLALPAGAIADMLDRRRMLLFTQGWMLASAAALGVLTVLGATTPWVTAYSYICSWRRRGDERPCLAGDDPGGCPSHRASGSGRLNRTGPELGARCGSGGWRSHSNSDRSLGGLSSKCCFVSWSDCGRFSLASRDTAEAIT